MLTNLRLLEERGKRLLVHGASRKYEQKGYQKKKKRGRMNRTEEKKREGKREEQDPVGHTAGEIARVFGGHSTAVKRLEANMEWKKRKEQTPGRT